MADNKNRINDFLTTDAQSLLRNTGKSIVLM